MKYIIVLGDGMADRPIAELGNQTPLEYASTPTMDKLSKLSEVGLVHTIPKGMNPGSDTANLSVIGYDPKEYYTGRSPLEALSIGVDMKETDVAIRCNIVAVSYDDKPYEQKKIIDHSSSEISTEDAAILLGAVKKELETDEFKYFLGTSYRHLTIWDQGKVVDLTPPHDILGKVIGDYLPEQPQFREMMKKSYEILADHPINKERMQKGLNPANSLWFWGAGTKPRLTSFEDKNHKKGAMISAVDLLKGIAIGAKMKVVEVEGADGTLHTNYEGKAQAAADVLLKDNYDFVYLHVEAPDEMGHQGSVEKKVQAINYLDERIIKPLYDQLKMSGEPFKMLVLPDHPTPISLRTHTSDPVPYMLYDSTNELNKTYDYNEKDAKNSEIYISHGHTLINHLFKN